jgi:peptidoglycan/xylan/chitin deacetylase (PgdA/CDA1 family)
MGWPEIQMLRAKGIEFGSHSKAHRDLRALPAAEVIADAMASRAILEDKLGGPVTAFSFPWGMETAAARDAVARAGYRVTVSTEPGFSRLGDDPFRLPRIEIMGSDTVADLARKLESPVPAPPAAVDLALPPAPADLDPLPPMAGRSPPAATRAPARLLHPDYLLDLSHRLDALIGEFVTLQNRMLRGFRDGASLQSRLVALFCQPLTGISVRPVSAGATLAPGIHLRFDDGITVNVTVTPKSSHALSPDSHLNSIGLQVSGASTWLALEINLDWPDLSLSRRFQLSLYAEVSRPMACQAFLRLPLRDGSVTESPFSSFVLEPHQGSAVVSGELAVPEFIYLDMQRPPQVLLSLECGSDLSITLHYLNLYFA